MTCNWLKTPVTVWTRSQEEEQRSGVSDNLSYKKLIVGFLPNDAKNKLPASALMNDKTVICWDGWSAARGQAFKDMKEAISYFNMTVMDVELLKSDIHLEVSSARPCNWILTEFLLAADSLTVFKGMPITQHGKQILRMKFVSALQNSHHSVSAVVADTVQVPHCYSAELVILLQRSLVNMQCVTFANRSIPPSPCVVFSIAFASLDFNLRFAWKNHLSFLEQDWPIFRTGIHTVVYTKRPQEYDSCISDSLFGDEHINMFAQQFIKWICSVHGSYTLLQTCQNKERSVTLARKSWVGRGSVWASKPNPTLAKNVFSPSSVVLVSHPEASSSCQWDHNFWELL